MMPSTIRRTESSQQKMKTPWVLQSPAIGQGAVPTNSIRLFCIPQAGMGAWAFHTWAGKHPPDVCLLPIELPGRNSRLGEPKHTEMSELVADLLEGILPLISEGAPYAIFGHSMGAWIGYELVKEIESRGLKSPLRLYVSANRAPHLAGKENDLDPVDLHTLSYHDFWKHFEGRYGAADPALKAESVRKFLWPLLQADFKLIETYKPAEPLAVKTKIVGFGALQDCRYTTAQLEDWCHCTLLPGDCSVHWVQGSHKYIMESPEGMLNIMMSDVKKAALAD